MNVVRQVIDVGEADALRMAVDAGQEVEIDVIDAAALAIPVHQINQRIADALDGRNVELHRPHLVFHPPGAERQGALVGGGRILHPESDGADAGTVHAREALREALLLAVDDEVDVTLAEQRDILGAMPRHLDEAHALEKPSERLGIGRGVLDELEAVGAHRIDRIGAGQSGVAVARHD